MKLRNGNVLCVREKGEWIIREYDRKNKEFVREQDLPLGFQTRVHLHSLPDGRVLVHDKNELAEVSSNGNVGSRRLLLGNAYQVAGLPDGNVLVASNVPVSRIYEIDLCVRTVWELVIDGKPRA